MKGLQGSNCYLDSNMNNRCDRYRSLILGLVTVASQVSISKIGPLHLKSYSYTKIFVPSNYFYINLMKPWSFAAIKKRCNYKANVAITVCLGNISNM